jgi:outer membrane biosynthesis protein TonB
MRKWLLWIAVASAAASGACASAQAKSPADRPTLEVPPVPPRVIESKPLSPPPPEPVEDLPPVAPLPPRARTTPPPREAPKPEPKPVDPAPVTEQPAPAAAAPATAPVPQLRTPETVDGAEATRQVHDVIERAKRELDNINYQRLTNERRQQYESAKLMVTKSEDALKQSDFGLARQLAEKAERLAKELQGR